MPPEDVTWLGSSAEPALAPVFAARAQFEAARERQRRLVAAGQLTGAAGDAARPTRTLPGYTLLHELRRGGQGVVYVALQESTGRRVAIKVLHGSLGGASDSTGLARFEREVDILSRLKHPNIVTVHDCGRVDGDVYLVMDFVDGAALDAHVERRRPPFRETLELFARICDGVHAAHLRGAIHRDLKPGNILVDEHGEPKLLDFGLAKLVGAPGEVTAAAAMTMTGQFVGSLPWASPEQAAGRSVELDVRTDVYSLGVVFYQILTRRFPYPINGRLDEVVRHIAETEPQRPSALRREVDRELETILLKALAKHPERRYQSAGDLARDLRRYVAGEPIEARRDSLAYLMSKKLARYRAAVAAGAALLLVALTGLGVSLTFWRQAETQRILAQNSASDALASAARADREAASARAVLDFLRDVLTSVEPGQQGADVRLIEVLDSASDTAGERFAALPQQEAQVRELLGKINFELSRWREAHAEWAAATRLWGASAGVDDPRALKAEMTTIGVSLNLQQYREAEAALGGLLPRMERVLGPDERETLAGRRCLAIALLSQGRLAEAEAILTALRAHPALADDEPMQTRLAITLIELLQWKRAGLPRGPERDASLAQEDALAHEWIERSTRLYGDDDPVTLQGRVSLAEIRRDQGRYDEAIELCRALLSGTAERLPECHDLRAWADSILATSLGSLGEVDEPAALLLQRIECLRERGQAASVPLLSSMSDALPYLERAGRAAEGEALAREVAASMGHFGAEHAFTAEMYVARFLSMQGRDAEAEALFSALRDLDADMPAVTRGCLRLFLGLHLLARERLDEAERELSAAAACLPDLRAGTRPTHTDDLILAFVVLCEARGDADGAAAYRRMQTEAWPRLP